MSTYVITSYHLVMWVMTKTCDVVFIILLWILPVCNFMAFFLIENILWNFPSILLPPKSGNLGYWLFCWFSGFEPVCIILPYFGCFAKLSFIAFPLLWFANVSCRVCRRVWRRNGRRGSQYYLAFGKACFWVVYSTYFKYSKFVEL